MKKNKKQIQELVKSPDNELKKRQMLPHKGIQELGELYKDTHEKLLSLIAKMK